MKFGDIVAVDGGELSLQNAIDGAELDLSINIDGGEIGTTTVITPNLQAKEAIPDDHDQLITADGNLGYIGLSQVLVKKIPSNWGRIGYNGSYLTVS